MLYDNANDANGKLSGCLIMYNERAVYVREVYPDSGNITLVLQYPGKTTPNFTAQLGDERLRYMELNIGYVNHGGSARWFYRNPYRQYRQGLRGDQLASRDDSDIYGDTRIRYNDLSVKTTAFADMLENKYPSIEEAYKTVRDGAASKMAFHKNFALFMDKLRKDFVIEYKGRPVGFTKDLDRCETADEYKFLREELQRAGIKVK